MVNKKLDNPFKTSLFSKELSEQLYPNVGILNTRSLICSPKIKKISKGKKEGNTKAENKINKRR